MFAICISILSLLFSLQRFIKLKDDLYSFSFIFKPCWHKPYTFMDIYWNLSLYEPNYVISQPVKTTDWDLNHKKRLGMGMTISTLYCLFLETIDYLRGRVNMF